VTGQRDTFGEKLRTLREAAGLSTYALARLTGITKQALSRLEKGGREPTWGTVQLLAAALGVSCEAFTQPVQLPAVEPSRPPGRPRKADPDTAPSPKRPQGKPRRRTDRP
jgi:transcriptional regulator with XRE-family HTH domain